MAQRPKSLPRQETKTSLLQRIFGRAASIGSTSSAPDEGSDEEDAPHSGPVEEVTHTPRLLCGHASTVGMYHSNNEDTFNVMPDLFDHVQGEGEYAGTHVRPVGFFAVFDGHGGHRCSYYAKEHLHAHVARRLWRNNHHHAMSRAVHRSFLRIDREFCGSKVDSSGSCSTCVIVKGTKVYCGNAGDSKAMLITRSADGRAEWVDLNERHSAELPSERARILKAGGRISPDGRVYGILAPSRAFGDIDVKTDGKPVVIADPDGKGMLSTPPHLLDVEATNILVLATDGLWDFVDDENVVAIVQRMTKDSERDIAVALEYEARSRGSDDDVTVVVVRISFPAAE